jgi:hypothetical protein
MRRSIETPLLEAHAASSHRAPQVRVTPPRLEARPAKGPLWTGLVYCPSLVADHGYGLFRLMFEMWTLIRKSSSSQTQPGCLSI